jgi:N-methylhydantoinase B
VGEVDPVSVEIAKYALENIANEMFWTAIRASKSPIFYETYDFSTAITTREGDVVAISIGLPLWAGVMKFLVKNMLDEVEKYEGISQGDIIISNDPYLTGTHTNDIGLVMPIFHKDEVIAVVAAKGHVNDVGGMNPGTWGPGSREIYQEGLFLPPVKFYREGKLNKEVARIILANTRIPDYLYGDLEALAAGLRVGAKRINELLEKYGIEVLKKAIESSLEEGREISLRRLKELPKGEFRAEDFLDDDYVTGNPLKLTARIRVTDEKFVVDFSENPKCVEAPINNTYPATFAAVAVTYIAIVNPHARVTQGLLEPLEVIAPPGTIFHAVRPYPVSVYWETMSYAADLVWKALAPYIPDRLSAGHFLSVAAESIAGIDPRTGEYYILVEPNPGGWGASIDKDGESALVAFADGETYANPVEILERRFPIIVERFELNTRDGVGRGRFRGGFGIVKDYRILSDKAYFTTAVNRSRYPPWGVAGGLNGTVNYMVIIRDGKELMRVARILNYELRKGDVVSIRTGGGGGWGDPLERDPNLVLQDVINEYISVDDARSIYGVVIDPDTMTIRWEETKELRERLKRKRSLS